LPGNDNDEMAAFHLQMLKEANEEDEEEVES
jgi:hypothetical protein